VRLLLASVVVLGASSCATTPETPGTSTEPTPSTAEAAPAASPATAAAPATPTLAAPPTAAAAPTPPPGQTRTGDGIDDENWLPRKDTAAYAAFIDAVETARRDPRASVSKFVSAASTSPGFYAAWFNAGAAAEAAGDLADAERHYRQALRVRADYGPAIVNLSTLLSRTGRDAEGARVIDDALRAAPDKAGPHLAAAQRAWRAKDIAGAEREAREAMIRDERNVAAMLVMAQVFRVQGRFDTARFAIDNALALEPGNALLHVERGNILLAVNEPKAALVAFERAARLRPQLAEAIEPYARLLLDNGFAAEAVPVLDTLVRLEPNSARAQLLTGNALRATKQYPQAEAAYGKALALDPNLQDAHFNLGVLYIDNAVGGADELARLAKGLAELKTFQSSGAGDASTKARLTEYLDATEKRIARETKKREREQKRKAEEAAKPADKPADPAAKPADPAATTAPAAEGAR
jgi:tetratricopeptide (TPR) repeat protein